MIFLNSIVASNDQTDCLVSFSNMITDDLPSKKDPLNHSNFSPIHYISPMFLAGNKIIGDKDAKYPPVVMANGESSQ